MSYLQQGSIINEEQHEVLLQDLVSGQNSENQNILENHFGLQDTFKRTMNGSSQRKLERYIQYQNQLLRWKINKLLATRIITSIHIWRGWAMKLKFAWYQLVDDILLKRNFDDHLSQQCFQVDAIKYTDFHKTTSPREKYAMPLHSMTFEHPSKSWKLNGVGKIFLDLFD